MHWYFNLVLKKLDFPSELQNKNTILSFVDNSFKNDSEEDFFFNFSFLCLLEAE